MAAHKLLAGCLMHADGRRAASELIARPVYSGVAITTSADARHASLITAK